MIITHEKIISRGVQTAVEVSPCRKKGRIWETLDFLFYSCYLRGGEGVRRELGEGVLLCIYLFLELFVFHIYNTMFLL